MVSEFELSEHTTDAEWQAMREAEKQSAFLVRYLLDGAGSRGRTKDLVLQYIQAFRSVNDVVQKERDEKSKAEASSAEPEPQTEEEEEERMRKRRAERHSVIDSGKKEIAQKTFDKVFAGWTEREWKSFENGFKASIQKK
jgi:hypothetical protein